MKEDKIDKVLGLLSSGVLTPRIKATQQGPQTIIETVYDIKTKSGIKTMNEEEYLRYLDSL